MAKKKKFERADVVVSGVLSYPDLANPKPFRGKIYYRTDVLLDQDDPQLSALKKKINQVRVDNWGSDKEEWPAKARKQFLQDGNEREDQSTYQDKIYLSVASQQVVPVIDTKGKPYAAAMVKGGMFAKVAICISPWENEGDEGMSLYLQGVMIDTSKEKLPGFGGGKSAKQLFGLEKSSSDENDDDNTGVGVGNVDEDDDDTTHAKKSSSFMDEEE